MSLEMASRSYSATELLRMRRSSPPEDLTYRLQNRLHQCPELSMSRGRTFLLYKSANFTSGDIDRRPFERAHSMKLTRIPEETVRETSGDSGDSILPKRSAPRQFDGTEHEWKYTGRNDSEEAEPQPISAPTGLEAQKIKGFQRFYQAVVSPTHVRVTAGGRIVPNNRASSPTTKNTKEKPAMNDLYSPFQRSSPDHTGFPFPPGAYGSYPMYPGFPPGVSPGGMHTSHPYMMPWPMPMGMPGIAPGFSMPFPPGVQMPHQYPAFAPKDTSRSKKWSESGAADNVKFAQAHGAEPIDPSRGNFYGGPMMVPPGGHFFPYQMAPPPGFPGAPYGMPVMAPPPMNFDTHVRPTTSKTTNSAENENPRSNVKGFSAFSPPTHPPVSSIRPSEITRRHLDILRSRLKYLEDQLSYNKHQIDEKAVEYDAQIVRQYIARFENTLDSQLCSEGEQYVKSETQQHLGTLTPPKDGTIRKSAASSETRSLRERERSSYSDHASIGYSAGKKLSKPRSATKITSTVSSTRYSAGEQADYGQSVGTPTNRIDASKSSLSRAAAIAAPFHPRAESSAKHKGGSNERRSGTPTLVVQSSTVGGHADGPQAAERQFPWLGREASAPKDFGVPYLVGQLAPGSRESLRGGFVYDRPLTGDELRARRMYWDETPVELQKTLPKFDGKDFFPASPVKARSNNNSSRSDAGPRTKARYAVPIVNPDTDPFASLGKNGSVHTRKGPGHSTQSEALPRREQGSTDEYLTVASSRTIPRSSRVGYSLDYANKGSDETAPTSSEGIREKSSSDETESEQEIIFAGRRAMGRNAA